MCQGFSSEFTEHYRNMRLFAAYNIDQRMPLFVNKHQGGDGPSQKQAGPAQNETAKVTMVDLYVFISLILG